MTPHANALTARRSASTARLHSIPCSAMPRSSRAHPFRSVRSTSSAPAPREQNAKARRPATRSSGGSSRACSACNASSHHPKRLNADVSVIAVASANQVSRRFDDASVILEAVLHPDSVKQRVGGHAVAAWPHHSGHWLLLECPASAPPPTVTVE